MNQTATTQLQEGLLLPNDREAEVKMLNNLLNIDYENWVSWYSAVGVADMAPEVFDLRIAQSIFRALQSLYEQHIMPDMNTVSTAVARDPDKKVQEALTDEKKASRLPDIVAAAQKIVMEYKVGYDAVSNTSLSCGFPSVNSLRNLRNRLYFAYKRRRLMQICQTAIDAARNPLVDIDEQIELTEQSLEGIKLHSDVPIEPMSVAINNAVSIITDNLTEAHRHHCIATPFRALNETGGLDPVGLQLIVGDTSAGKSSLAMDFAVENIRQGLKAGYVNMEMPNLEMAFRLLSKETGLPMFRLQYDGLSADEYERVLQVQTDVTDMMRNLLPSNDIPRSMSDLKNQIRRMVKDGCSVVYVDYLQILSWSMAEMQSHHNMNQEALLARTARELHTLSLMEGICIVLLSQVNRDRDFGELTLDRIRDSKQIADACKGVLLINRPERYGKGYDSPKFRGADPHGTALLDMAKRRNGPTVKFLVRFVAEKTHFEDLPEDEPMPSAAPEQPQSPPPAVRIAGL